MLSKNTGNLSLTALLYKKYQVCKESGNPDSFICAEGISQVGMPSFQYITDSVPPAPP